MKRNFAWLLPGAALVLAVLLCATVFRKPLAVAYHQWRMNAALDTLYSDPNPKGGFDVTGVDVDVVMNAYQMHRQALVDLGVYGQLKAVFPNLTSDGSPEQSDAVRTFVERLSESFPDSRHWHLDEDGHFEIYAPIEQLPAWRRFLQAEKSRVQEHVD